MTITDGSVQELLAVLKVVGISPRPFRARAIVGSRGAAALDFRTTCGPWGQLNVSWLLTHPRHAVLAIETITDATAAAPTRDQDQ
jgi:hypothetical protein